MIKKIFKIAGKTTAFLLALVILICSGLLIYRTIYRNKVLNENKITSENGIDENFVAEINGIKQYFHTRGEDKENPIILFIHGGPGSPMSPMIYTYQKGLEKDYTIVNWDQRNAGKTYFLNENIKDEVINTLSIEQSISDIYETVRMLKERYDRDIIIMGHSWGSTIGTIFANRYPDMIEACIGVGQNVSITDGEKLIAEETLKVISDKDRDEYMEIVNNENNLNLGSDKFDAIKFSTHRKISGSYLTNGTISDMDFAKTTLLSPYYSLSDVRWFLMNNFELQYKLLKELSVLDLRKDYLEFKVPMIYIAGTKDWITPYPIVEEYYNKINAPYKDLIYIEDAGHTPMMDNPEVFCSAVINALKEANQ